MPEVKIPYLTEKGRYYPLLTEDQILRMKGQIEDLKESALEYDKESDLVLAATQLVVQAKALGRDLETNERLMKRPDVKEVVVTFKEPTLADVGAWREAAASGKGQEKAVELLSPAIEGMAEIPIKLYPIVVEACVLEFSWSPSEDRRFFSIRWPSEPPDS